MPDVKIKGYSGNELEYQNVPKVYLSAPESTPDNPVLVPFTYGEAIEGVEVEPDFSDGDMQITAPDGYLIRSVVVKKPETLVPENIVAGVDIAGIVGAISTGASVQIKYTAYTGSNLNSLPAGTRINIDFGFAPDFILMYTEWTGSISSFGGTNTGRVFMGYSTSGAQSLGAPKKSIVLKQSTSSLSFSEKYEGIEVSGGASTHPIYGADETGFNIGVCKMMSGTNHILAIKFT